MERLKRVSAYIVSNCHLQFFANKPFNPILGETFQQTIKYSKSPDNPFFSDYCGDIEAYYEQTNHHPPIMNYYIKHKNYTFQGYENISIEGTGNSIIGKDTGKHYLIFNDGTKFKITYCDFNLGGIIFGKMYCNYTNNLIIEDLTNKNICVINMCPKEETGFLKSLFSSKKKNFPDYFKGFIAQTSEVTFDKKSNTYKVNEKSILSKCEGEFTQNISWDGKVYWELDEKKYALDRSEKMKFTLPSDSSMREDILFYRKNKIEFAQQAKMFLEERQRSDRKLREKFEKQNKK